MHLQDLIKEGTQILSSLYPEREAREIVYAVLEKILGTTRHTHILEPSYKVSGDNVAVVRDAFSKLSSGEPLQYVLNEAWFYGRRFNVSPDVLIPRPETELLCRTVIDGPAGPNMRVLDLCTGSGCIAWTLALEMPGSDVVAVDISDGALNVADSQDFSEEMSVTGARKPGFVKADVLSQPLTSMGKFDIIVSNPPYVMESEKALMRKNVLDHEPHLALFVSDDDPLLFYRAVANWALLMLKPGGYGIVEINEALGNETADVFTAAGFSTSKVIQDLSGRDRFVLFR